MSLDSGHESKVHVELVTDRDTALYNPTKPMACSIEAVDIPDHLACLERIRSELRSVDRTRYGVVLHVADSEANASDVARFVGVEQRSASSGVRAHK